MERAEQRRLVLLITRINKKNLSRVDLEVQKSQLSEKDRKNLELDIEFEKWARKQIEPITLNYSNIINNEPTR